MRSSSEPEAVGRCTRGRTRPRGSLAAGPRRSRRARPPWSARGRGSPRPRSGSRRRPRRRAWGGVGGAALAAVAAVGAGGQGSRRRRGATAADNEARRARASDAEGDGGRGIEASGGDPSGRLGGRPPDDGSVWRFLIGWRPGSEPRRHRVDDGPNPSWFHPPSLRPGAPIGQAPPVFLSVHRRCRGPASRPCAARPAHGCLRRRHRRSARTRRSAETNRARLTRRRRPANCPATPAGGTCQNRVMEITWYGQTCVRMRGRDAVVVADAYQSVVGPTGRGITADIATYSHPTTRRCAKAKGRRTRDGKTSCRAASRTPSPSTPPASTRSRTSS